MGGRGSGAPEHRSEDEYEDTVCNRSVNEWSGVSSTSSSSSTFNQFGRRPSDLLVPVSQGLDYKAKHPGVGGFMLQRVCRKTAMVLVMLLLPAAPFSISGF